MPTRSSVFLLFTLLACHRADPEDSAAPVCQEASSWAWETEVVPPNYADTIEVGDAPEWKVTAVGDCIEAEDGSELCPTWDLSSYHFVDGDGYLVTDGSEDGERVTNLTDRDWTVAWSVPVY